MRKQRSSLVLTDVNGRKTVFWASGTVQETGSKAAGWIFAFDCATNSITAALAMSQGEGAGIWMGGQGLAADDKGFLYAITGNGDFDGQTQYGESFVKVQYTPASGGTQAKPEGSRPLDALDRFRTIRASATAGDEAGRAKRAQRSCQAGGKQDEPLAEGRDAGGEYQRAWHACPASLPRNGQRKLVG